MRASFTTSTLVSFGLFSGVVLSSCANQDFRSLGADVFGGAGYLSGTQIGAFFDAGENLVQAATPLTEEQEYYLGRGVAANILGRYPPVRNDGLQRYVTLVGKSVAAFSDRPSTFRGYHFVVLDSADINAMAAPSGFIFISKGLLRQLKNEEELAAVLAHEVAHVVLGHGVDAIASSKITKALGILGNEAVKEYTPAMLSEVTDLFSESVNDVTEKLLTSGYSRSQEYRADEYAVTILSRAGYDPNSLRTVLDRLEQVGADSRELGGWYDTHPEPAKRVGELAEPTEVQAPSKTIGLRTARFSGATRGVR